MALGALLLRGPKPGAGPGHTGAVTSAATPTPASAPKGPQPIPVRAAVATQRGMTQTLDVTGTLRTDEDVQIGARREGKVVQVTVKEGDRVRRGQLLVRLDDRELRAELARARASLQSGEALLSRARNQATWKDVSAQSEHERALAALRAARTRVQRAETSAKLVESATRTNVETAVSGVKVAQENLAMARESTRKQVMRQAELAVEQAVAQLDQAKVDAANARQVFERRQSLYQQDAIAREEVDEAERRYKGMQANVQVAEGALEIARQKLELAGEGEHPVPLHPTCRPHDPGSGLRRGVLKIGQRG